MLMSTAHPFTDCTSNAALSVCTKQPAMPDVDVVGSVQRTRHVLGILAFMKGKAYSKNNLPHIHYRFFFYDNQRQRGDVTVH